MPELVSRIPAEEVEACKPWSLSDMESERAVPTVGKNTRRLSKETLRAEAAERTRAAKKNSAASPHSAQSKTPTKDEDLPENNTSKVEEAIEDVSLDDITGDPMSAEHLQHITEAAEKEGYDAGFAKGLEDGKKEGIEQGIAEGIEEGKKQEQERIQDHVDQLSKIIESLTEPLGQEQAALEEQVVYMVCELTRAMVKRELQLDASIVHESVEQCLALLHNSDQNLTL